MAKHVRSSVVANRRSLVQNMQRSRYACCDKPVGLVPEVRGLCRREGGREGVSGRTEMGCSERKEGGGARVSHKSA